MSDVTHVLIVGNAMGSAVGSVVGSAVDSAVLYCTVAHGIHESPLI